MRIPLLILLAGLATSAAGLDAQALVVDEGSYAIEIDGTPAGLERFTIRRAGVLQEVREISSGTLTLGSGAAAVEVHPLLEVVGNARRVASYQVKVSGDGNPEVALRLAGGRYVASIRSRSGEEEREYRALPGTRILEEDVAHLHHYLEDASPGQRIPVIEPRTGRSFQLEVASVAEDTLRIGWRTVPARRMELTGGADSRSVWFDGQGRVLRVEVPARKYVAVRQDIVG